MKLNKYLFSTFIAASTLLISSCSDFLDRSPQGQFTEDDNPNALVNGKIYNVYTMMRSFDITAGTPAIAIHYLRSEDSEKGSIPSDGSDVAEMYDDFLYTPTNGLLGSYWGKNYAIIYPRRHCRERDCRTNRNRRYHQQRGSFFLPCLLLLQSSESLWRSTFSDLQDQRCLGSQHSEDYRR